MAVTHGPPDYRPNRVVILGSAGFVGSSVLRRLELAGVPILALPRTELDLTAPTAGDRLATLLQPDDSLVFAAAQAPVKNNAMLLGNLQMAVTVCAALAVQPVGHLVYISSDAVYADGPLPLTEASPTAPGSLHGVMHLTRELMLASTHPEAFCIVRPTLIYGSGDPHNGYGPNQFLRLVEQDSPIVLFGEGEERRDHVHIDDVAELVTRIVCQRSTGVLNIATGHVTSFRAIAEAVITASGKACVIKTRPRSGPMPHDGYRPFDSAATYAAFHDFTYSDLMAILHSAASEAMPDVAV